MTVQYTHAYLENMVAELVIDQQYLKKEADQLMEESAALKHEVSGPGHGGGSAVLTEETGAAGHGAGPANKPCVDKPKQPWPKQTRWHKQQRKAEFHGWMERTAALIVMVDPFIVQLLIKVV